jgi:HptB-dependent secretion and biofilm anti anti-sigma factor
MSIVTQVSEDGSHVTISVFGQFNFNVYQDFRQAYKHSIGPGTTFEVNLEGTEYLDSAALGMLLLLREQVGSNGSKIRISNCRPEIRKILNIANFERLFDVS